MDKDKVEYQVGIIKLQVFINTLLLAVILLSMYVAFFELMEIYEASGIKGFLTFIVVTLMFVLMGFVNHIIKNIYYQIKELKSLFGLL